MTAPTMIHPLATTASYRPGPIRQGGPHSGPRWPFDDRGHYAWHSSCESAKRPEATGPMPTYQYRCRECGEDLEVQQSFSDDPLTTCPSCQGSLRKVFSAVGISFKGSGFYKTDSRGGTSATSTSSSSTTSADSSTSSASPSGDSSSSSSSPSTDKAAATTA